MFLEEARDLGCFAGAGSRDAVEATTESQGEVEAEG